MNAQNNYLPENAATVTKTIEFKGKTIQATMPTELSEGVYVWAMLGNCDTIHGEFLGYTKSGRARVKTAYGIKCVSRNSPSIHWRFYARRAYNAAIRN